MSTASTEKPEASRENLWPDKLETDPAMVAKIYDTFSSTCRNVAIKDGWTATFNLIHPLLKELFLTKNTKPQQLALDAGCGDGLLPEIFDFQSCGVRLHAIDISPAMVELAKNNKNYEDAQVANLAEDISLRDSTYDVIISNGVLGYIATAKPIYEFLRKLKPGGRCIFTMRVSHFNERGFAKALDDLKDSCKVLRKEVFSAFPNNPEYTHDYLLVYFQKQ